MKTVSLRQGDRVFKDVRPKDILFVGLGLTLFYFDRQSLLLFVDQMFRKIKKPSTSCPPA